MICTLVKTYTTTAREPSIYGQSSVKIVFVTFTLYFIFRRKLPSFLAKIYILERQDNSAEGTGCTTSSNDQVKGKQQTVRIEKKAKTYKFYKSDYSKSDYRPPIWTIKQLNLKPWNKICHRESMCKLVGLVTPPSIQINQHLLCHLSQLLIWDI